MCTQKKSNKTIQTNVNNRQHFTNVWRCRTSCWYYSGRFLRANAGTDAFAGLPTAMFTLGSALAAFIVGKLSQRYGRRIGLATGFIVGGFGAIGVVMAALTNSIILLLISLLIYGAGTATNLQARYAGTDLADKKREQRLLVLRW